MDGFPEISASDSPPAGLGHQGPRRGARPGTLPGPGGRSRHRAEAKAGGGHCRPYLGDNGGAGRDRFPPRTRRDEARGGSAPAIAGQPVPGAVRRPRRPWRHQATPAPSSPSLSSPPAPGEARPSRTARSAATPTPDSHARRPPDRNRAADGADGAGPPRRRPPRLPRVPRGIRAPRDFQLGQHLLAGGERIINRLDHLGHPSLRVRPRILLKPPQSPQSPQS